MRVRLIWLWRVVLAGFAVAYLLSASLQLWLPPWLPFLAAAAVEAQFFVSGARRRPPRDLHADRGPQARDLADFGWADGTDEPGDEEPSESLEVHDVQPAALPRAPARRRLLQLALVLALLSGLFLLDRSRPTWQKLPAHERAATLAILERQATRIAGHQAQVVCDVAGRHVGYVQDADGLAVVGGRRMWVTSGICYRLAKVPRMSLSTE
ncbi:MAG TPA: hypothetical protein VGF66_01675, partial [Gaiellaceae bacterium]